MTARIRWSDAHRAQPFADVRECAGGCGRAAIGGEPHGKERGDHRDEGERR